MTKLKSQALLNIGIVLLLLCLFNSCISGGNPSEEGYSGDTRVSGILIGGPSGELSLSESNASSEAGTPLAGYKMHCVTSSVPVVEGVGTADANGNVTVVLKVRSGSFSCSILNPQGTFVATLIFWNSSGSVHGPTITGGGDINLSIISVNLTTGEARATVPANVIIGGGGGGTVPPEDQVRSTEITNKVADDLVHGVEDFPTMITDLNSAQSLDPNNTNLLFFRAVIKQLDFLRQAAVDPARAAAPMLVTENSDPWLKLEALDPACNLYSLYTRAGYVTVSNQDEATPWNEKFWDFYLKSSIPAAQGDYMDLSPTSQEINTFVQNCAIPQMEAFLADLEQVPASFEFAVYNLDPEGDLFDSDTSNDTAAYWIDYGDVSLLKAAVAASLAGLKASQAYTWGNVNLNDFDSYGVAGEVDAFGILETKYSTVGLLSAAAKLSEARELLKKANAYYNAGSLFIRSETTAQADNGVMTLARNSFDTVAERNEFLQDEASARNFAQTAVNCFDLNGFCAFTTDPTGQPMGLTEINFFKFFQGIDFKPIFWKMIVNPVLGIKVPGVTDLSQFTADMLNGGGLVGRINGEYPTAGDLQLFYSLRVNSPAYSTKIIDGSYSDWSSNRTLLSPVPKASLEQGHPDFGDVYGAVDASYLYLYVSGTAFSDYDDVEFDFETASEDMDIECHMIYWPLPTFYCDAWEFSYAVDINGNELSVPLANFSGDWVQLDLHQDFENADKDFEIRRTMFLYLYP